VGELGLLPEQFWALTYAEFIAMARGFHRRQVARANEILYGAWHTELFARYKKLPDLDDILRDPSDKPKKKEPQTTETMMTMAKMLTAAFGGDVVEVVEG